ncbi:MAG: hypothetical protein LBO78_01030, partial [Rickettsiales bacterium]|nr:hypothetical protein [Rickettsiales bacterium]
MKDFKEWIEEFAGGEKVESIEGAIEAYYRRLRKPKKPYNPVDSNGRPIVVPEEVAKFCDDVAEFASKNTNYTGTSYAAHGIKVIDDPSWSYRYLDAPRAKENESKETTLRLSLNVRPDKELIKALDALVLHDQERKFIRNYKSPSPMAWDEWARRHDPVTIYLWKISPNMLKAVAAAIAPYVREGPELIGEKVADGVYLDQEPTVERVQSLLQRAKSAGPAVFGEISNIP